MYADYDSTFLKPVFEGKKMNVRKKAALKIKAWEVRYNRQWGMTE